MNDPRSDAAISRDVAQDAGQLLLQIRQDFIAEHGPIADKEKANKLRDRADAASNDMILDFFSSARPQDAVLSEEAKDDPSRLDSERVWIVDPLDGTWEYGQNRADFAVHVALWAVGELHACTVDLPAQGITRSVLDDTVETSVDPTRPIRMVASRSRPPATLQATCDALGRLLSHAGITDRGVEVVDVGSVGAKVNEILSQRADVYLHDTGFYEWDVAAPYGVAAHYGLRCSNTTGEPITFNHMPPYVNNLVVAHPVLYPHVMHALAETAER